MAAIIPTFVMAAGGATARPFAGINLASGGFAPDRLPGRHGVDYLYPDAATAAPFLTAGMTVVRLPVLWERLQPVPGGELDSVEMTRVDGMLDAMSSFRLVILDIHNYGRYRDRRLDSDPVLEAAFADLWTRLAKRYADRSTVAYGLMNEPHDVDARAVRRWADLAIAAIRATGARNLVLVPGTAWTGAHAWTAGGESSNAAAFTGFRDPADRFVFEMHDYLDANGSGTSRECPREDLGEHRLEAATAWLRTQGRRAILGEFGAGSSPACTRALERMLAFVERNADVWMGWTYWAGGAWWGDYFTSVQPVDGRFPPQMQVLKRHIP